MKIFQLESMLFDFKKANETFHRSEERVDERKLERSEHTELNEMSGTRRAYEERERLLYHLEQQLIHVDVVRDEGSEEQSFALDLIEHGDERSFQPFCSVVVVVVDNAAPIECHSTTKNHHIRHLALVDIRPSVNGDRQWGGAAVVLEMTNYSGTELCSEQRLIFRNEASVRWRAVRCPTGVDEVAEFRQVHCPMRPGAASEESREGRPESGVVDLHPSLLNRKLMCSSPLWMTSDVQERGSGGGGGGGEAETRRRFLIGVFTVAVVL